MPTPFSHGQPFRETGFRLVPRAVFHPSRTRQGAVSDDIGFGIKMGHSGSASLQHQSSSSQAKPPFPQTYHPIPGLSLFSISSRADEFPEAYF